MDPLLYLSMLIVALALALAIVVRSYQDKVSKLKERLREMESTKRSQSTIYGRISEQWAPFLADYPYDPQNFRFLGSPVDGVQFEADKIVFVEIKTNTSRLNPRQQELRRLVEEKRVEWYEMRLAERAPATNLPTSPTWGAERPPP